MKSTKCVECGFVGWSDLENCKACGAPLRPSVTRLPANNPYSNQPEGQQKGMAIAALILGVLSFLTFGLLGVGAVAGIILAIIAMGKTKREPWRYGGHGLALAGLVLNIFSLVMLVPIGIIAAIAIPNLLASRIAANEAAAMYSLRQLNAAQMTYYNQFEKFGTLPELGAVNLIDPKLAAGTKSGYNFALELTTNEENVAGFTVTCVPVTYSSSGRRSFYIDESGVIRGGDNNGRPPSKMDEPVGALNEYPSLRRVDSEPANVY